MKIEAEIVKLIGRGKLKAIANIKIDDQIVITGIRIVDGSKGRFVSMPSRKNPIGLYVNVCFPITRETRNEIERVVLEAYAKKLEEM